MRCFDEDNRDNISEENDSLASLLHRCGRFTAHYVDGTRGQGSIMRILVEAGEITQGELREKLGVQPGSLSEVLSRLEARGFITRTRDEDDRRKVTIKITDDGRQRAEAQTGEEQRDIFSALTEDEQAQLTALLKKLIDSWTPIINERRSKSGRDGDSNRRNEHHGDFERRERSERGERRERGEHGERGGRSERGERPQKGGFTGHNRDDHPSRGGRGYGEGDGRGRSEHGGERSGRGGYGDERGHGEHGGRRHED